MVKKFLLSAAVIGALSTSAMAYNVNELSMMSVGATAAGSATPVNIANDNNPLTNIGFNQTQLSNALIFPAYFTGNGWESTIRVINPDPNHAVVAKVVLYDGKDSHEVRDFNIYLSANDVWVGKIKVDSDGVTKIISTDDSTPLEDGTLASADNPFSKSIDSNNGYIEVIAMAVTDSKSGADHDHAGLRTAYERFAKIQRTGSANPNIIFANGVIKNQVATTPYINVTTTAGVTIKDVTGADIPAYFAQDNNNNGTYESAIDYAFATPRAGTTFMGLTGDIRITDTVNGKDMDMMPYKVNYDAADGDGDGNNNALVYIEGEKANIADVFIQQLNNVEVYNPAPIESEIQNMSLSQYFITYGDAPVNNMYAILTNPFKRVYVQANLDQADGALDGTITPGANGTKIKDNNNNPQYYTDASVDVNGNINYGSTSVVAQIFDESENMMSAGQFSPATTPTVKLTNEVATTGYDVNDANTLAYYLNQAAAKGYTRGYVKLSNVDGLNVDIPGIMTQMLATQAGNKVVTNWIVPQGN